MMTVFSNSGLQSKRRDSCRAFANISQCLTRDFAAPPQSLARCCASISRHLATLALCSTKVSANACPPVPSATKNRNSLVAGLTAALMLGLNRVAAARFSFLMSIPVIVMAGGYEGLKMVKAGAMVDWNEIALGTAISFASALACIHWFLKILSRLGMLPFVLYRLALGIGLFVFLGVF